MFKRDQIVNIRGGFEMSTERINDLTGAFRETGVINFPTLVRSGNDNHNKGATFDASRVVQTGDRVMPRTVFENLYLIISE